MNAADLIREAEALGAELYLDGECLRCRPAGCLPAELKGRIKANAEAIKRALSRGDQEGEALADRIAEEHGLDRAAWRAWIADHVEDLPAIASDPKALRDLVAAFQRQAKPQTTTGPVACAGCRHFERYEHTHLGRCALGAMAEGPAGLWHPSSSTDELAQAVAMCSTWAHLHGGDPAALYFASIVTAAEIIRARGETFDLLRRSLERQGRIRRERLDRLSRPGDRVAWLRRWDALATGTGT